MNQAQKNRLTIVLSLLILLGSASSLVLYALKQNINLFLTPTELTTYKLSPGQIIKIGGYVEQHSVIYDSNGQFVTFRVTDRSNVIIVNYHGILPNLFREGQTVVVTGKITDHILIAEQVLAKHDEKYMPKPLQKELQFQ